MKNVVWLFLMFLALVLVADGAGPDYAPKGTREDLLGCTVFFVSEHVGSDYETRRIDQSGAVEQIRQWILKYAWPPIDPNTVGSVMENWFIQGGNAEGRVPLLLPIYHSLDRLSTQIHISFEAQDELRKIVESNAPVPAEPTTFGDWSAVVDGLRGRLSAGEMVTSNGNRHVVLYLELQNVGSVHQPIQVLYPQGQLSIKVSRRGEEFSPESRTCSFLTPRLSPIASVFHHSTVRVRLSEFGWDEKPHEPGLILNLRPGFWLFPPSKSDVYHVSGVLEPLDRQKIPSWQKLWGGQLTLPPLTLRPPAK